jgi:hypothetical protein
MSKDVVNVKSNGLRNELKEIRKSIDKLTDAIIQQTNKHYENNINTTCCNDSKLCKCKKAKNS